MPNVDKDITDRIKELGEKSTQILIFLSFAIVAAATLSTVPGLAPSQQLTLKSAIQWWVVAIFPVLLGIAPLKEMAWQRPGWYCFVRWLKVGLLWLALIL